MHLKNSNVEVRTKNVNCQKAKKFRVFNDKRIFSLALAQAGSAYGDHMCAELAELLMYRANINFTQHNFGELISFGERFNVR